MNRDRKVVPQGLVIFSGPELFARDAEVFVVEELDLVLANAVRGDESRTGRRIRIAANAQAVCLTLRVDLHVSVFIWIVSFSESVITRV